MIVKTPGRYTGYAYEGIWRAAARRWLKRVMSKAARREWKKEDAK